MLGRGSSVRQEGAQGALQERGPELVALVRVEQSRDAFARNLADRLPQTVVVAEGSEFTESAAATAASDSSEDGGA